MMSADCLSLSPSLLLSDQHGHAALAHGERRGKEKGREGLWLAAWAARAREGIRRNRLTECKLEVSPRHNQVEAVDPNAAREAARKVEELAPFGHLETVGCAGWALPAELGGRGLVAERQGEVPLDDLVSVLQTKG